jgi:type 1 glutamine amidotransferase
MKTLKFALVPISILAFASVALVAVSQEKKAAAPVKALLVTGGGYHDYKGQEKILTEGVAERIAVSWDVIHKDAAGTKEALSKPGWADKYDIVVYNLCHAHEKDASFVESLAKIHESGKPAVAIHCSMHSYHWKIPGETKHWPAMLGVTSPRHGKHAPITVTNVKPEHPVMKGFPKEWVTPKGELYHIDKTWPTATVLAKGSIDGGKSSHDCVWVNEFGKGRVFGTTLGHHNETMQAKEYLDMVSNAITWATGKKAK